MKKSALKDHSVQLNEEYSEVLKKPSFEVNIRLLKNNFYYKRIMRNIEKVMIQIFAREYSDYGDVQGISGPNIGIPLRIIVIKVRKKDGKFIDGLPDYFTHNESADSLLLMINPVAISSSRERYTAKSNCGSLILEKPINVMRHEQVEVSYYDLDGEKFAFKFGKPLSATIQHEIDHLNGITILDRQIKE